jgi:hypothetical protein
MTIAIVPCLGQESTGAELRQETRMAAAARAEDESGGLSREMSW